MADGALRRCGRCEQLKPLSQFNWRRAGRGQRDNLCRPCRSAYHREHYLANKQRYVEQAHQRKERLRQERTAYLLEYFARHPCVDCGESDPVVLEFDHLNPELKSFNIGQSLPYRRWQSILKEIEKCEVVCQQLPSAPRVAPKRRDPSATDRRLSGEAGDRTRTGDGTLEGSCVTTYTTPASAAKYR